VVLIKLGNLVEIRKNLKACFDAVESEDYTRVIDALSQLRFSLRKYYITRGKPTQKLDSLIEDAINGINVTANGIYKKGLIEEDLETITIALRGETPKDPNTHLQEIFEELRYLFGCEWQPDNAASIIDLVDEITALKDSFVGNNFFSYMTQRLADCIPLLITVSKTKNPPTILIEKLTNKFADMFVAVQHVFVPPIRVDITRKQVIEHLQNGVSMKDVSDGTGMSEAELRNMIVGTDDSESETEA